MQDYPLVSIIIPTYNCEKYVAIAVQSCLNQTYKNIEIIVVDDGSTDNTYNILQQFKEKITLLWQKNSGAPKARNKGLIVAKGIFIKFLDSDDILLPDAVEKQVKNSLKYRVEDRIIIYGNLKRIDGSGQTVWQDPFDYIKDDTNQIAFLIENNYIVTSCPMHRKKLLEEIGGFNEDLLAGQEQDLHLRLAIRGVRFKYVPDTIYYYRSHYSKHRMASSNWSKKNPEFGITQIKNIEFLIKALTFFESKKKDEVERAIKMRHLRYAKSLVINQNHKQAIEHFLAAKKYKQSINLKSKSELILSLLYLDYKLFGLHISKIIVGMLKIKKNE